jgi:hypothetical protein
MQELDPKVVKAERLEVLCQRAGFALWQLQTLETSSAQGFVLLAKATPGMGQAAGQRLMAPALRKTFGKTVHAMRQHELISGEIERRFIQILEERNWLVHRSKTECDRAITDESRFEAIVERLDQISEEALDLMKILAEQAVSFAQQNGVSPEAIELEEKAILEEWRRNDEI